MKKDFLNHTYDDIGRIYNFSDSSKYYSVTTMLSNTKDETFLKEWRKRVGEREANRITEEAGVIGTAMHECLEKYLLKQPVVHPNVIIKKLCNQIIPYLDKRVKAVYRTEEVLYSDSLGLAGATDAIVNYEIKGVPTLTVLDFKTAKAVKRIEWIQDYCVQLCTYGIMIGEIFGKYPTHGVLLFAYKEKNSPYKEVIIELKKYEKIMRHRVELFHKKVLTLKSDGV